MILILSDSGDYSTDLVIDWLNFYNAPFIRLNSSDLLESGFNILIEKGRQSTLKIKNKYIETDCIHAVWFRKYGFFQRSDHYKELNTVIDSFALSHVCTEFARILQYTTFLFKDCYWLTDPKKVALNKLNVLSLALKYDFKVPDTYITNCKQDLCYILKEKKLISKSVFDPLNARLNGQRYMMYTTELYDSELNSLPETFFPSLVQEKIEKEYEIRTFYIEGKCYSMAIMSQKDKQTELDFRKYNWKKPNRFIPIKLSTDVEQRVCMLMNDIGLNTGSLDFIQGKDGILYFLEINPTGQFGMVEFSCNYPLHQIVAQTLINNDKE